MNNIRCEICYLDIDPISDKQITLTCGHTFHKECIHLEFCEQKYSYIHCGKHTCPYCRQIIETPIDSMFLEIDSKKYILKNTYFQYSNYKSDMCCVITPSENAQCRNKVFKDQLCRVHKKKVDKIKKVIDPESKCIMDIIIYHEES
jgi:hypothetical protein